MTVGPTRIQLPIVGNYQDSGSNDHAGGMLNVAHRTKPLRLFSTGISTRSDDRTSVVVMDADTQSIGPDGSEEADDGHVNAAFDSKDFSMIMNDSAPSVEVSVEISRKAEPCSGRRHNRPYGKLRP